MNIARDYANNVDLKLAVWKVFRIWECEIRTKKVKRDETLSKLFARITGVSYSDDIHHESLVAEPEASYDRNR